jgi:hypothetical protein
VKTVKDPVRFEKGVASKTTVKKGGVPVIAEYPEKKTVEDMDFDGAEGTYLDDDDPESE